MTNLRKYAEGKPCMIRIPDVCNGDDRTTVLAHFRMVGISGMGIKSPDLIAAWACYNCHQVCDRQAKTDLDADFVRLLFLEGVIRTQAKLIGSGLVKW